MDQSDEMLDHMFDVEKSDTEPTDVENENTALSMGEYIIVAQHRASVSIRRVDSIAMCIGAVGYLTVVIYLMMTFDKYLLQLLGASAGLLSYVLLYDKLSKKHLHPLIKKWADTTTLPEQLIGAPLNLEDVFASYLTFLNGMRAQRNERPLSMVELKNQLHLRSFFDYVRYSHYDIYYDFPEHRSIIILPELEEDFLYIQNGWDVERKLVTSILFSVIEYVDGGRKYHYLELGDDGKSFRGINTDTISLGSYDETPDEEEINDTPRTNDYGN